MATIAKAVSTTPVVLSSAGAYKKSASVYYDGATYLYVIADSQDPSASLYTVKMGGGDGPVYWAPEGGTYFGEIRGVLASGTGTAQVTEYPK